MTLKRLRIAAFVLTFDAALLLIVGIRLWTHSAPPADQAVGKGLVTLGVALAVPAFVALVAWLDAEPFTSEAAPARNDGEHT